MSLRAVSATLSSRVLPAAAALVTLAASAIVTAPSAGAGSGFDPKYRYCLTGQPDPYGSVIPDCSFDTIEQCRWAAAGMGYCIDNPAYAGVPARRAPGR